MPKKTGRSVLLCAAAVLVWPGWAAAQIPDEFTNLKILDKDMGRREIVSIMRQFSGALGVRCNYCHVGEDPFSLEGYDFASDEKETKRVARAMMQMSREINTNLLPKTGRTDLLPVRCVTCHHGQARPQTLRDILAETLEQGGVEAAVARYRELRQASYGRGAYDFGEFTLLNLAEEIAVQQQKTEEAQALLELNLEFNPESWMSHFTLGSIHQQGGDPATALEHFEKAAEINPEERRIGLRVQALRRQLDKE